MVAASIGWVDGYAEVLHYDGKIGFIPSSTIKPGSYWVPGW